MPSSVRLCAITRSECSVCPPGPFISETMKISDLTVECISIKFGTRGSALKSCWANLSLFQY